MRGVILAVAPDGTYGQISAEDGERYSYWTSEVRNGRARVGDEVDFQMYGDQPIDIFLMADRNMPAPDTGGRPARPPRVVGPAAAQQRAQPAPSGFLPFDYWLNLFGTPWGRISRRQFWLHGVLPIVLLNLVLSWIPGVNILVTLLTFWGSICISFKRFHDCGYAGWWSLLSIIPSFIASILAVASFFTGGKLFYLAGILWLISLAILVAQLAMVYMRVGQQGANQYGPDPLG